MEIQIQTTSIPKQITKKRKKNSTCKPPEERAMKEKRNLTSKYHIELKRVN